MISRKDPFLAKDFRRYQAGGGLMSMIFQALEFLGDVLGKVALVICLLMGWSCQAVGRPKS